MFRVRFNSFRQKWAVQSKSLENTTGVKRPHRYRRWTVISKPIAKSQTHRCQGTSPRYFVRSVATSTDLLIPKLSFQRPRNRPELPDRLAFPVPGCYRWPFKRPERFICTSSVALKTTFSPPTALFKATKIKQKTRWYFMAENICFLLLHFVYSPMKNIFIYRLKEL